LKSACEAEYAAETSAEASAGVAPH
jgi:hypothetical protein